MLLMSVILYSTRTLASNSGRPTMTEKAKSATVAADLAALLEGAALLVSLGTEELFRYVLFAFNSAAAAAAAALVRLAALVELAVALPPLSASVTVAFLPFFSFLLLKPSRNLSMDLGTRTASTLCM